MAAITAAPVRIMLVKFYSKVGRFTMFGDIAIRLLRLAGHSGTVPGAIRADEVPAARERLRAAVAACAAEPAAEPSGEDEDEPPPVTLSQRAFPLLDLMERCAEEDCDLLWDKG